MAKTNIIKKIEDRIIVSTLLKEIQDRSLQKILRKIILGNQVDNIVEVIHEERPQLVKHKTAKDYKPETIKLSQNVRVSDPCYDNNVWCKTNLTNVLAGNYNVFVEKSDEGDWGIRVKSLMVIHELFLKEINDNAIWEMYCEIGVDSGQAGIFCETSYRNDSIAESIETSKVFDLPPESEGDKWYGKMCDFTLSDEQFGFYETGVVTSTGYGDGCYPLEVVKDKDGNIVGMKITYL